MNVPTCTIPSERTSPPVTTRVCKWVLGGTLALAGSNVFAGAWTQPEGTGQAILGMTTTSNDRYFDDNGSLFTNQSYRKAEAQLRIEYGMTDSLTGFVGPSLLKTSAGGGDSYFGAGYTDLGVRQRLYTDGADILSYQATARLPGAYNSSNAAEVGYTGVEYDLRALYGRSFRLGNWPAFVDAEFGRRIRNGSPPNEWRVELTLGARPAAQWLVLLQSFSLASDGRGDGTSDSPYRYQKIQPSIVWDFAPKWSAQLGAVTTITGRNSWREQGIFSALWYRF